MPRGGKRSGQPGVAYTNRTDLNAQPVRAASGQTYGQRGQQEAAQQMIPLPQADLPHALDPTTKPDEPLTAGMPFGPGAGPEVLSGGMGLQPVDELRALYRLYPYEEIRKIIEYAEQNP